MILPAQTIRKLCNKAFGAPLIEPFEDRTLESGVTYGLGPAGYDIRIDQTIWLWPLFGRLASSMERFSLPNDLMMEVKDKSTWARRFVLVQNTVAEPGWEGYLTVELTRMLPWPVRIREGTAIAQVIFTRLEEPTEQPYEAKAKYQNQKRGPQPPLAGGTVRKRRIWWR